MHQCLNGWNYFQITSIESNPWVIFQQANVEGTVYDNDDCLSGVNYYIPFNISNPSVSIVTGLSGCNGTINTSFGQELLPLFLFSSESSRFCLAPTPDVVGSSCIFVNCASNPCFNGATCVDYINNTYSCNCAPGYSGSTCSSSVCTQTIPCSKGNCSVTGLTTYSCDCNFGWTNSTSEACDACSSGYFGSSCTGPSFSFLPSLPFFTQQCSLFSIFLSFFSVCPSCENGTCFDTLSGNGTCSCNFGWTTGSSLACDTCLSGNFGSTCQACPACGNGSCNAGVTGNGTCSCSAGWAVGSVQCDVCAPGYYGPSCAGKNHPT